MVYRRDVFGFCEEIAELFKGGEHCAAGWGELGECSCRLHQQVNTES